MGGGAYQGTLNNCSVIGNCAISYGGGAAYQSVLNDCVVIGNCAPNRGGGVYLSTLNNCLISSNSANYGGGAYYSTLNNCTAHDNAASLNGGGATAAYTVSVRVANPIGAGITQLMNQKWEPVGRPQVAIEVVDAGVGDYVFLVRMREASLATYPVVGPVDLAIVGVVDHFDTIDGIDLEVPFGYSTWT